MLVWHFNVHLTAIHAWSNVLYIRVHWYYTIIIWRDLTWTVLIFWRTFSSKFCHSLSFLRIFVHNFSSQLKFFVVLSLSVTDYPLPTVPPFLLFPSFLLFLLLIARVCLVTRQENCNRFLPADKYTLVWVWIRIFFGSNLSLQNQFYV